MIGGAAVTAVASLTDPVYLSICTAGDGRKEVGASLVSKEDDVDTTNGMKGLYMHTYSTYVCSSQSRCPISNAIYHLVFCVLVSKLLTSIDDGISI